MDQTERRRFLIRALLNEQPQYRDMDIPGSEDEQKRLLRSLFNIRMPADISSDFIRIQDEYLRQRNFENGIVYVQDIPAVSETGSTCPFSDKMSLWQGDITRLAADAIVNAANSQMLGCFVPMHTCIDNCIHTFAGIQLRAECSRRMEALRDIYGPDYEQPTAVPMLTEGYNLPAKKVIHIVGPIVTGALSKRHEQELSDCYRNILDMCLENGLGSVAFCCISTGVFRFPAKRASGIAVQTVTRWFSEHPGADTRVIFNVFKDEDREYYEQELY